MSSAADIKGMILAFVRPALIASGQRPETLDDSVDLRAAGLIDSLGFLQLLAALEERLGGTVDVADLDPEQLTNVGALSRHIAAMQVKA